MSVLSDNLRWLSKEKIEQLEIFSDVFREVNANINLVSRKDIEFFTTRHILHSLAIAHTMKFKAGTHIADVGTGGGLPGLPLAIVFPDVEFVLIDSIGKKIKAVQSMADTLGLKNVATHWGRMEEVGSQFDFVVSRAVKPLPTMMGWLAGKFKSENINEIPNGLLYLKGGDFSDELESMQMNYRLWYLSDWFNDPFFETKMLVWINAH